MKIIDSIYKITKDMDINLLPNLNKIDVAKNEDFSFYIILNDFEKSCFDIKTNLDYELFYVYYHHVKYPSTLFSKPGEYPDALVPLNVAKENNLLDLNEQAVLLASFKSSSDDDILLITENQEIKIEVSVLDIILNQDDIPKTVFGIFDEMFDSQERVQSKEEYIKEINDLLLDYKICSNKLVATNLDLILEEIKLKSIDESYSTITLPNNFIDNEFDYDFLYNLINRIVELSILENQNYLSKLVIYNTKLDEPYSDSYHKVFEHRRRIDDLKTKISRNQNLNEELLNSLLNIPDITTTFFRDDLYGGVDTWCPTFIAYQMDELVFEAKNILTAKDKIWWYGCVWPLHPYPNYHIDDNFMNIRVLNYLQFMHKIKGNLYWGVNLNQKYNLETLKYETFDVWKDPMVFPPANGDGYLMYEPTHLNYQKMIPSLRLEHIKLGVNDYQYCMVLNRSNKRLSRLLGFDYDFESYYSNLFSNLHNMMQISREENEFIKTKRNLQELILLGNESVFVDIDKSHGLINVYSKDLIDINEVYSMYPMKNSYKYVISNLKGSKILSITKDNRSFDLSIYFPELIENISINQKFSLFETDGFLNIDLNKEFKLQDKFMIQFDIESYSDVPFIIEYILVNDENEEIYLGYKTIEPKISQTKNISVELPYVTKFADIESTSFANNYYKNIEEMKKIENRKSYKLKLNLKDYKTFQKEEPRYKTCYRYELKNIVIKQ